MITKFFDIKSFLGTAAVLALVVALTPANAVAQETPADGQVSAVDAPAPPANSNDPVLPSTGESVTPSPESAAAQPVPRSPETVMPEVTSAPPEPSEAELKESPPPPTTMTSMPDAAQGEVAGTNVMGDGNVQQTHSGTYYDADALVPDRDLVKAGAVGPRKVDPALEPGQKFIVVEKGASATSFEGQYVAATRALKLGRYTAAMEMFENLYKKNHRDPRVLMGLAIAQQGAGFNESAAQTYEDLLRVQPNNADAMINLMGIMRTQYPEVSLRKLMDLRAKFPTNPGIPAQIGLTNAEMKNYDDALRYMEIAATMEPRNPSHIYNMAIITDRSGNPAQAIKLYEQALQIDAANSDSVNGLPREQIYDRLVVLRRKV